MKNDNPIGTTFTTSSTNHTDSPNGPAGLPLMSEDGKRVAAKSAPTSLSRDTGKIPTSSMDRMMRGSR
jgi:hypothetical protein